MSAPAIAPPEAANPPAGTSPPAGAPSGTDWVTWLQRDPANAERVFKGLQSERDSLSAKVNQISQGLEQVSPFIDKFGGEQVGKFLTEYLSFAQTPGLVDGIYHYLKHQQFPGATPADSAEAGSSQNREDGDMIFTPEEESIRSEMAEIKGLVQSLSSTMQSQTAALGGTSVETHMATLVGEMSLPPDVADRVQGSIRGEIENLKRQNSPLLQELLGANAKDRLKQSMQSYITPDDYGKIEQYRQSRRQTEVQGYATDGLSPVPTTGTEIAPDTLEWETPGELAAYAEANPDKHDSY